jgi:hypothetical protein
MAHLINRDRGLAAMNGGTPIGTGIREPRRTAGTLRPQTIMRAIIDDQASDHLDNDIRVDRTMARLIYRPRW